MEQPITSIEFTVGLSREEYIYSQGLISNALRGKHLLGSRWFSVVMMILCVLMVLSDRNLSGRWDMSLVAIVVMMIVAEVWMFLALPSQQRKAHGAAYDKTVFHGYSFDGVVTVSTEGITKRNAKNQTHIPFSQCLAFIEDAEMMVFCIARGKSILLPKRFLTVEDAEFTRRVALAAMSPARCYLLGRVACQLTERLPLPEEGIPVPEEPLLSVAVVYEEKELKGQVTEAALRSYVQKLPQKTLIAVFVTILAYFGFQIEPIPTFLLCSVLLFVFSLFSARSRVGRALAVTNGDAGRSTVTFTESGIRIRGNGGEALNIPWQNVTRAVESPRDVELYVNGEKSLIIPKRCIEDMESLRRIVDTHLPA